LAQGALDLPPCTTLEEWHAFRAGLNQLMYTRYGVTVDDACRSTWASESTTPPSSAPAPNRKLPPSPCRNRSESTATESTATGARRSPRPPQSRRRLSRCRRRNSAASEQDARALRRLFHRSCPRWAANLPARATGRPAIFQQHQALLLRSAWPR
jgi:hypothetical protein